MQSMTMPHAAAWDAHAIALAFVMWSVMMVAMMVPSASPMVLTFHRLARSTRATAAFLGGYLLVWIGFSVLATALQAALQSASLMTMDSMRTTPLLGGVLFLTAGVWQLTPLREACLSKCRSPVTFLMSEWRDGLRGAITMGTRHGRWCVACCWALMLLLFAAGVMSLVWVAAIALWVLLEKMLPDARWLSRAGAMAALAWGAWLVVASLA